MTKLDKKPRSLIVTIALASAAVGYVAFVFLPGQKAIGELRSQLHEKQQYIVQAERLKSSIQHCERDLKEVRQFTEAWRDGSPSQDSLTQVFGKITDLASQSGTKITKFERQPVVEKEAIWHIAAKLQIEGDFVQVFEFVRRLEGLTSSTWLANVQLAPATDDSNPRREVIEDDEDEDQEQNQEPKSGRGLSGEITLMIFADKREISD